MRRFVPCSPHLFRPLGRSLLLASTALLVLAAVFPAPLEIAADPAAPPNPAKSAWFLLGVQELVSWGTPVIYLVMLVALLLVALPWLSRRPVEVARWFPPAHRALDTAVVVGFVGWIVLTAIGLWFRGPGWRLAWPF